MTEEHLFALASQAPPAERAALLDRECAGQPELRARIEALLAADAKPNLTVDSPANATESYMAPGGEAGAVIAGRYTLVEFIDEGGMGEVWVAKQTEPVKRKVALKLIKAGMDSKAVMQRFEAERQALALMDHPNIAKVLDGGMTAERRPFFVMELVNGLPLTKFCDEAKLGIRERLELFVSICQAVQHAHQKGIIHRDLKPSNILVTVLDGKPIPKIIDFGVAKAVGGRLTDESLSTQFGAVVGTFEYMSPEQAGFSAADVDTRADIYSLGVVLYELLTGLKPIDAKRLREAAMTEMIRIIKEEEPSKPSTRLSTDDAAPSLAALRHTEPKKLAALLRGELDWVVMKCLEKQRDRRYETANGLARDIQRYLADEPVEARPPSAGYRFKKFVRRNRGSVVAASVVAATLVLGIIGTAWQWQRASNEQTRTQQALNDLTVEEEKTKAALAQVTAEQEQLNVEKKNTVAALNAMTDDVVEKLLGKQKKLSDSEKDFLQKVIRLYEQATANRGDTPERRALRADGHYRVAKLQQILHLFKEAEENYVAADDLLKALADEFPAVPEYRSNFAASHNNLGLLLFDTGRGGEAEAVCRAARDLRKALAAEFPAVPEYQIELAMSHNNLGNLLRATGRGEEAEAEYRAAGDLFKTLAVEFPSLPAYRDYLAASHDTLGILLLETGRGAAAEAEHCAAQSLRKALAAEFPAVPEYRSGLANNHNNLGNLLCAVGRGEKAEAEYRAARDLFKGLTAEFPAVPQYRNYLAGTHSNLGNLLSTAGRAEESEAEYRAARDLFKGLAAEFPAVPDYHNGLAGTLVNWANLLNDRRRFEQARKLLLEAEPYHRAALMAELQNPQYRQFYRNNRIALINSFKGLGDHAAIPAAARDLVEYSSERRGDNYGCASDIFYAIGLLEKDEALTADRRKELAKQYADEAMKYLKEAVANGWKDREHIKKDKDLDPLRDRDDFKKLLAELETKSDKK